MECRQAVRLRNVCNAAGAGGGIFPGVADDGCRGGGGDGSKTAPFLNTASHCVVSTRAWARDTRSGPEPEPRATVDQLDWHAMMCARGYQGGGR